MQCRLPSAIVAAALAVSFSAHAEEGVTLIARGGIRAAIEKLVPESERKTGLQVKATFSGLGTKQQVARGDAFDVPIVQPPFPEVLASGNVLANSAVTLASVSVGVAVRQAAPKPDISTADAVKRTLIAAKSVSFPNPAGDTEADLKQRLADLSHIPRILIFNSFLKLYEHRDMCSEQRQYLRTSLLFPGSLPCLHPVFETNIELAKCIDEHYRVVQKVGNTT